MIFEILFLIDEFFLEHLPRSKVVQSNKLMIDKTHSLPFTLHSLQAYLAYLISLRINGKTIFNFQMFVL